ncbi:helix-turn-helix domain-containing protein [Paraburkholderia sediminicola]|uniref:helix-turn-helix domain-containing protein n=1 Tax=Paraburkholderia sediminicola TaxID=458836 RepID=UPI0038BA5B2C
MSGIAKLLSILELLSELRPVLSAQDAAELGCSVPTAYRYLRERVESGVLQRFVGGE